MGSPLAGLRIVYPRSERRFSLPIWVRYTGQFLVGPPTSVCRYLRALSLRVCCNVVLAVSRHFFSTLPSFLPAGVGASVGGSALRPAAAGALFPGVPL